MLLSILGDISTFLRLKPVPAPVLPDENVFSATSTTASSSFEAVMTASSSYASPSMRATSLTSTGSIPIYNIRTEYGPPGRMPPITYRPSVFVTAEYCVPDGACTATTAAPGRGSPDSSVTWPFMPEVVT